MLVSVRLSQHTIEIKQEALLGKQFELATQVWASATGQIYEPVYETIRILDIIDAIELDAIDFSQLNFVIHR